MPHAIHDIGVASQIGAYSDAVEARPNLRWLLTSGTPGLSTTGDLPKDISGQAELAWGHVVRMLDRADMSAADLDRPGRDTALSLRARSLQRAHGPTLHDVNYST